MYGLQLYLKNCEGKVSAKVVGALKKALESGKGDLEV